MYSVFPLIHTQSSFSKELTLKRISLANDYYVCRLAVDRQCSWHCVNTGTFRDDGAWFLFQELFDLFLQTYAALKDVQSNFKEQPMVISKAVSLKWFLKLILI